VRGRARDSHLDRSVAKEFARLERQHVAQLVHQPAGAQRVEHQLGKALARREVYTRALVHFAQHVAEAALLLLSRADGGRLIAHHAVRVRLELEARRLATLELPLQLCNHGLPERNRRGVSV
jgi:hypothetical protein